MQLAVFIHGDQLVGSGSADDGHLHLVSDRGHGDVAGGEVRADLGHDVMYLNQVLKGGNRVGRLALTVHGDQLKHLAVEDAAVLVDLLDGQLGAVLSGGAPQGGGAGQVGNISDLNGIRIGGIGLGAVLAGSAGGRAVTAAGGQRQDHRQRQQERKNLFHNVPPSSFTLFIGFNSTLAFLLKFVNKFHHALVSFPNGFCRISCAICYFSPLFRLCLFTF